MHLYTTQQSIRIAGTIQRMIIPAWQAALRLSLLPADATPWLLLITLLDLLITLLDLQHGEEALKEGGADAASGGGMGDLFDVLSGGRGRRGPQKAQDTVHKFSVPIKDFYMGTTKCARYCHSVHACRLLHSCLHFCLCTRRVGSAQRNIRRVRSASSSTMRDAHWTGARSPAHVHLSLVAPYSRCERHSLCVMWMRCRRNAPRVQAHADVAAGQVLAVRGHRQ